MTRRHVFAGRSRGGATATTAGFSSGCYVTPDLMLVEYATAKDVDKRKRDALGWIFFRSKREAKFWIVLSNQQAAGEIRNLQRQVKYLLHAPAAPDPSSLIQPPPPIQVSSYTADYTFERRRTTDRWIWDFVVADAKGFPNDTYPIKKKWMAAEYGIHIEEL